MQLVTGWPTSPSHTHMVWPTFPFPTPTPAGCHYKAEGLSSTSPSPLPSEGTWHQGIIIGGVGGGVGREREWGLPLNPSKQAAAAGGDVVSGEVACLATTTPPPFNSLHPSTHHTYYCCTHSPITTIIIALYYANFILSLIQYVQSITIPHLHPFINYY